ncbi:MAG: phosphatase PAP2 family protein [Muribaculaceae bacterium]
MRAVIVSLCFLGSLTAVGGELLDSVSTFSGEEKRLNYNRSGKLDRLTSSQFYKMTYIGVPLIIGGALVKSEDDHFRSLRNDYLPQFNRHLDDYLQFSPAAVMLGMKTFGVESRSSWGRMIVSDAFSALLMGGAVNTLKHSTNVVRPDGSNNHSFPSGHTATAFMTATMLTKEYGHKSAWVGIGAYSVASATGLMRMANNKHWLSDVLTGAGIGILSAEFGYYFADLLFKDKGINRFDDYENFSRLDKPSFVGLYLGFNVPLSKYDIDEQTVFRTSSGSSAGVEGAYFFNPYMGIGGRFVASNTSIIVNDNSAEDNTYNSMSMCGGAYFSYPISSRLQLGGKLLGGYVYYPRLILSEMAVHSRNGACFGSGTSLTFRAREHCGVRFFLDYNVMSSHSTGSREWMNMLTCGAAIAVTL